MLNLDIIIVFATLLGALVLFVTDWVRYDIVALLALLVVTVTGILTPEEAFNGFSQPAVIVVAAVLVVSRGLYNAGIVDVLAARMISKDSSMVNQLFRINGPIASVSGFMSNTGALALFLPVVLKIAREKERSPSLFLIPLAASGLLGGLLTLIGTPPNLIIADFSTQADLPTFTMFDYTPVGLGIAVVGVIFICTVGWRLLPNREVKADKESLFEIADYVTKMRVEEDSPLAGVTLQEFENTLDMDVVVVSILRGEEKSSAPSRLEEIEAGDDLLLQIDPDQLDQLLDAGLALNPPGSDSSPQRQAKENQADMELGEVELIEAIITANSSLVGQQVRNLDIRWRHGINLLAVARQEERITEPLEDITLRGGDIVLLQGSSGELDEALSRLRAIPVKERTLNTQDDERLLLAGAIFVVTLVIVATGLLAVEVMFPLAAVAMILAGFLSLEEAYEAISWPILILIGAMLPLGDALEKSGGAEFITGGILTLSETLPPVVTLAVLLVVTMILSNFVHNAAVAALAAPIAVNLASGFGLSAAPFLMAVAVGASATFMTPIGHQANTIVMEVGNYNFGDYWRFGLPLSIVVAVVAVPLIVLVWPF
jgi:di/tricarboxylate transporter